jgi:hypothetical protein
MKQAMMVLAAVVLLLGVAAGAGAQQWTPAREIVVAELQNGDNTPVAKVFYQFEADRVTDRIARYADANCRGALMEDFSCKRGAKDTVSSAITDHTGGY